MDNYWWNEVLKDKKITDYLAEHDIFPARMSGNKIFYRCPVHQGDNDPSFVVFEPDGEKTNFQTYYCFGCHSGTNIFHLVKDMEECSFSAAVKKVSSGIDINVGEIQDNLIEKIKSKEVISSSLDFDEMFLGINVLCREHLKRNNDMEELIFFDIFFEKLDKIARSRDIRNLEKIYNMLKGRALFERAEMFQDREDKRKNIANLMGARE